jgi:uncharacterized protein YecE (DUF72 family)
MHKVLVGTSGWNYEDWKGSFYPEKLPRTKWLEYYACKFQTIEVNATFYHEMRESTYKKWREGTPDGFCWAVKANRFITHIKRLRDVAEPLKRFFGSASVLGDKLGPVLFQLPPSLAFDRAVLEEFCASLHDAARSSAGLPEGVVRCAIEPRHESWMQDEALAYLRELGLGFCISDTGGRYPYTEAVTSDFAYIRLHGPTTLYASSYSEPELERWAARIAALDKDAYIYFDNSVMAYAPTNALELKRLAEKIETLRASLRTAPNQKTSEARPDPTHDKTASPR